MNVSMPEASSLLPALPTVAAEPMVVVEELPPTPRIDLTEDYVRLGERQGVAVVVDEVDGMVFVQSDSDYLLNDLDGKLRKGRKGKRPSPRHSR
jgi:hypothetical protein